jgi:hypothetical protein
MISIALALTGSVLIGTMTSEVIFPGRGDFVDMLEYDLTNLTSQTRGEVVLEFLDDIETIWVQPVFAHRIALDRVNMHGARYLRSSRNGIAKLAHIGSWASASNVAISVYVWLERLYHS